MKTIFHVMGRLWHCFVLAALVIAAVVVSVCFPRVTLGPRERAANWLLEGVHIHEPLHFGQHSITLQSDLIKWSATATPSALGQIGMDVTTGVPSAYVNGAATSLVYNGSSGAVDTAADGSTLLLYKADEASGNLVNSGSAGSATLTAGGTPLYRLVGNRSYAVGFPGTARDGFSGATAAETATTTATIAVLVRVDGYQTGQQNILAKMYAPAAWVAPFTSMGIDMNSTADGIWRVFVAVGGVSKIITVGSGGIDRVIPGEWTLLGATYDGANLLAYKNDRLVGTLAAAGTIDWGTHGSWNLGAYIPVAVPSNGLPLNGAVRYARVENTVRALSWFQGIYRGMIASGL